jgi:replicative DNA helicase
MVIFIHRPDFLGLSENPEDKEKTFIIIAKHRNGETGELPMLFKSEQVKFIEPDQAFDQQAASFGVSSAMNDDYSPFGDSSGEFANNGF